jgi:nitrogen fixation-related uncharacterized protein
MMFHITKVSATLIWGISIVMFFVGLRNHGKWSISWTHSAISLLPFVGAVFLWGIYSNKKQFSKTYQSGIIFTAVFSIAFYLNTALYIGDTIYLTIIFSTLSFVFYSFVKDSRDVG